ncbi:MAG: glycosyl hydrolase, partial [Clostridiales bacterium]|nr:glycosyl hydrolase [Clostridiales bacterium]
VSRVLRNKFRLELFENPYSKENYRDIVHGEKACRLSLEAAYQSMVLLKNKNNLLPLNENSGKIALIGPNVALPQLGDYTVNEGYEKAVSIKRAFEERLGDRLIYSLGCGIASGSDDDIEAAVKAALKADTVILVLGDNSSFYGGVGWGNDKEGEVERAVTCGEGFDLSSLDLPGRQQELMERVYETGKNIVLVMVSGRPYSIVWADEHIHSILQAWYPGEFGGYALYDIIFGKVNPSGKLPISFPKSAGHIPCFYNYKMSARGFYKKPGTETDPGRDYVFSNPDALYPFGYGLSYTTFEYSDLIVSPVIIPVGKTVTVKVKVKNTGNMAGFETVQLYLRDEYCRITTFVRTLRGFEKVFLEPGEEKTVSFILGDEDFAFINEEMKPEIEPGKFIVYCGNLEYELFVK